jgi:hypothetical protein
LLVDALMHYDASVLDEVRGFDNGRTVMLVSIK